MELRTLVDRYENDRDFLLGALVFGKPYLNGLLKDDALAPRQALLDMLSGAGKDPEIIEEKSGAANMAFLLCAADGDGQYHRLALLIHHSRRGEELPDGTREGEDHVYSTILHSDAFHRALDRELSQVSHAPEAPATDGTSAFSQLVGASRHILERKKTILEELGLPSLYAVLPSRQKSPRHSERLERDNGDDDGPSWGSPD